MQRARLTGSLRKGTAMTELLTAAQMRAIEEAAIASGEVTGLELMERAGRGVVEAIFQEWPELAATSHRAVVLSGPGNNGGDGFVVARLLKDWGWEVEVFLYGDPEKMPPDARVSYERWRGLGVVRTLSADADTWNAALIVDALFGTGLTRRTDGELYEMLRSLANQVHGEQHVCAVDCPSGLCLDSGRLLSPSQDEPPVLRAGMTVTFSSRKVGHFLASGPELCGKVAVADIGLPWWTYGRKKLSDLYELLPPGKHLNRQVVFEGEPNPSVNQKGAYFFHPRRQEFIQV
jgi:hydroxyethylthiazole kinase-like uncharacterized protein yjeF